MDIRKFCVKFDRAEDAQPEAWKTGPLAKIVKRPVGRPPKRKTEPEDLPMPKKKKMADEPVNRADEPINKPEIQASKRGQYKAYTVKKKRQVVEEARLHGVRPTAELYKIPRSTLSDWMKIDFDKITSSNPNGHAPRPGRPISYGSELDEKIISWVLKQRDMQLPVSIEAICIYARSVVSINHDNEKIGINHNQNEKMGISHYQNEKNSINQFQASRGWAQKFMRRHNLSLRAKTSLAQRLLKDLEEKIASFQNFVLKQREDDEYDDNMIINMDETPVYFDIVPGKTVDLVGQKSVKIRTTGSEKRHVTAVLAIAADGTVLPSMVIFKGKRELKLKTPSGWIIAVQEKAWMDETLMLEWVKEIFKKYTKKNRSLLVLDSFRAHLTDKVKKELRKANAAMAVIPGGCTSKLQPLDVSCNKPVKYELKRSWSGYISEEAKRIEDESIQKLKAPEKQLIVDWLDNTVKILAEKKELVRRSFKVCGITNHHNGCEDQLIRNDDYIREFMSEEDDDNDFEGWDEEDVAEAIGRHSEICNRNQELVSTLLAEMESSHND